MKVVKVGNLNKPDLKVMMDALDCYYMADSVDDNLCNEIDAIKEKLKDMRYTHNTIVFLELANA